ncbi:MAG: flagellar assembly protein FliW [Longimicrobiales bacterium]
MTATANPALTMESEPDTHANALDAGETLVFDDGLFGFPECRCFTLHRTDHAGLFWLQSTEHEALGFLVADPFLYFDGYSVDLAEPDVKRLEPHAPSDIAILATITIADNRDHASTANLQGPIAINVRTGRARQVIVNDPSCSVRQPIELRSPHS